jgi:predicted glycosyltransferase
MRIVVDVNHPGHVHFFKNFIWEMEKKGHDVLITATEKDVAFKLLDNYYLDYINLGSYGNSLIQKLINIPIIDLKMYMAVKSFKPDVFLGLGSVRAAHVSFLIRKKCILFEDTEHSTEQISLYLPFIDHVYTPSCFTGSLGKKQIRYNGYHELAYLHPNYFTPNPEVLSELELAEGDQFVVLRFVSWDASHDIGHHGIQNKIKFVKELEKYGRVLITSEGDMDTELEKYKITVSPEKLHNLLYYASLYIGEGATTASECAVLGTHAIYVNTLRLGYTDEEENRYGLVYNFSDPVNMEKLAFDKALVLLKNPSLKEEGKKKREKLLKNKIDVTKFLVKLIENVSTSSLLAIPQSDKPHHRTMVATDTVIDKLV